MDVKKQADRLLSGVPEQIWESPWVQDTIHLLREVARSETDEKKAKRGTHTLANWDLGPVMLEVWYDAPRHQIEAIFLGGLTDIYDTLTDEQVEAIRKVVMG